MVAGRVRNKPLHGSWRFRFGRSVISYYRCAIRDVTVGDLARNGHLESRAPRRNSGFEAVLPDGDIEFEPRQRNLWVCAGMNRHGAEDERALRERSSDPLGPEFCAGRCEVSSEA
jgi:hypothetical protein